MLAVAMIAGFIPQSVHARDARLWVEGHYITGDVSPIIHKNRTLVPLRQVAEALGLDVEWNAEAHQVLIKMNGATYAFIPGKAYYSARGVKVTMDTETIIQNNRTYLPLRVIAEVMGKTVSWDAATYTAIVGTGYTPDKTSPSFHASAVADTPARVAAPTPARAPVPNGPVGQGLIRGNRKSHIYHMPGGASYNKIALGNIVYFETETQAQAAGYRRAER